MSWLHYRRTNWKAGRSPIDVDDYNPECRRIAKPFFITVAFIYPLWQNKLQMSDNNLLELRCSNLAMI